MRIDDTFKMVRRALDVGHPAHGYLIVGPVRGVALDLAVRILQVLFCRSSEKPCGTCDGCRHVVDRQEVDIHWIFPEKKSRIISADQIREKLINEVTQTSFSGGWKAGVLVGADRLNDASANAFLKTLEEPPEKTLFMLLSDAPQQLLPTIISRCQRIDLDEVRGLSEPWKRRVIETLASPLLSRTMEKLAMSNVLFSILADMKGKAEQLITEEESNSEVVDEDGKEVFEAKVSARYRELRTDFLLEMLRWFRDMFVLKAGGDDSLVHNRANLEVLKERVGRLTLVQTIYNLNAVEELARQMERNLPEETLLGYALDRLNHGVA
ncbi:MAG TPA: DNA polymerase III subunit [Kiritimatiellia bacterium]|nr:DNA polymerase III subunit [Kiritimatiellia bacterium]HPS06007.1 DNA polymerase III subunit [Kiritimatiellia bacterium]